MREKVTSRTPGHYLVAKDFVTWLTRTKQLSIRDYTYYSYDDRLNSDKVKLKIRNQTWNLVRYAVDKLEHVECFSIDGDFGSVDRGRISTGINFPRLKALEVKGMILDGNVKLDAEVPTSLFTISIKRASEHEIVSMLNLCEHRSIVLRLLHISVCVATSHKQRPYPFSFGGLSY